MGGRDAQHVARTGLGRCRHPRDVIAIGVHVKINVAQMQHTRNDAEDGGPLGGRKHGHGRLGSARAVSSSSGYASPEMPMRRRRSHGPRERPGSQSKTCACAFLSLSLSLCMWVGMAHFELDIGVVVLPPVNGCAAALVEIMKVLTPLVLQEAAPALLCVGTLHQIVEDVVVAFPLGLPHHARLGVGPTHSPRQCCMHAEGTAAG
jgi:hypothetical protein